MDNQITGHKQDFVEFIGAKEDKTAWLPLHPRK
jgi:hypothetical protein